MRNKDFKKSKNSKIRIQKLILSIQKVKKFIDAYPDPALHKRDLQRYLKI